MGTFLGHAIPGTFFIFFGLRWTIVALIAHFRSITINKHKKYHTAASFTCAICSNVSFEGLIKLTACCIGIACETATGFRNGHFVNWGNSQHVAMYFFYGLNGAVDIVINRRWPVPKNLDYVTMLLAATMEMLLFYFHIHGRNPLDSHLHILLILSVAASCILILIDAYTGVNASFTLARSVATMVHGTWFWQIGFILYNPLPNAVPWSPHDHDQMILATDIFVLHIVLNIAVLSVMAGLIWLRYRNDWNNSETLLTRSDEEL